MRKILTVALLSSALAAPAFAADLTTPVAADATTAPVAASAEAKPAVAIKSEKKFEKKHAHKVKKQQNKTM